MLKRALLACALIASPAAAQDANWYVGTWRDLPIERAPGPRVVLHHVEIAQLPSLRPPQQFSVHLWARCTDNPANACDIGTVVGAARRLRDGSTAIFVEGTPRANVTLPCRFNILFASAYIQSDPTNPESRKRGIDYRITPPNYACRHTAYDATSETLGTMDRMIAIRPDARPTAPSLPPRP